MKYIIGIFFFCTACVSDGSSSIVSNPYHVSSLLADFNSNKLTNGQLVSVYGYLTFGDDKHNLWESEKDYKYILDMRPNISDPVWKRCISLDSYGPFRSNLLKNDGKNSVISGYISRRIPNDDEINLGSCSDVSISLEGQGTSVVSAR